MRIGYSHWNYISDIERDSPGGGNFYIGDLVGECSYRGHVVYALQPDRDSMRAKELGKPIYYGESFLPKTRECAHQYMKFDSGFPELDILLIEWRWQIPGRNTPEDRGRPEYTSDLERQRELLNHYRDTKTTIVLWDLDHKITLEDELAYPMAHIIETSVVPRSIRTARHRVHIPFDPQNMNDHTASKTDSDMLVAYIGNYYERDRSIDEHVKPCSTAFPGKVHFVGNWRKYPEVFGNIQSRWPNIQYHDRIAKDQFQDFYGKALTCPLIAKDTYYNRGFLTARYLEALYFRCLPVGFSEFYGIEYYLQPNLIVKSGKDYVNLIEGIQDLTPSEKEQIFQYQFNFLEPFKPSHFVDTLEELYGKEPKLIPGICKDRLELESELIGNIV